jgi:hypothetical protein
MGRGVMIDTWELMTMVSLMIAIAFSILGMVGTDSAEQVGHHPLSWHTVVEQDQLADD